jgi:putative tricarboxylic transport membrane protein
MTGDQESAGGSIRTRYVELIVALALVAIGLVVVVDSHRVGIEWADDGPKAGYFPNFIGWILTAAGAWIAGTTLVRWKALAGKVFVSGERLKPVLLMLVPTLVYIVAIALVGIYVASALFIGAFMRWQGKYPWWKAIAVGVAVPAAIFALFELWFLVPLPKGPLERLLGF